MARPKTTPIMKIGIMLMIGPGWSTPTMSASQPHWKTATTAPSAAATESRKPSAAFSGTRIERKTSIRSTNARPTTSARYGTSASSRVCEKSMVIAVWPVTRMSEPVSSLRSPALERIVLTSSSVL
ncbi:hypothetical protein SALBM135S_10130 [Streptomyces alboniger]